MKSRDFSAATRSIASDPDILSMTTSRRPYRIVEESEGPDISTETLPQETDADGDDDSDHPTPGLEGVSPALDKDDLQTQNEPSEVCLLVRSSFTNIQI